MARKREREAGGHPVFWLLLGFLCGVMATLGALLMFSGAATGDGDPAATPPAAPAPIETPALDGALLPGGPVVLIPLPPRVEPATPIQEPVAPPALPDLRPEPPNAAVNAAPARPAPPRSSPPVAIRPVVPPRPAPPAGRSNADQMAEDAAASGMTARTR